jgi:hypothetical protein
MSLTAPDQDTTAAEGTVLSAGAPERQRRRTGTRVVFDVCVAVPLTPERAWRELTDWGGHGDWIPLTRVDVDPADPSRFVAWSGIGRAALEDRMHAEDAQFDGVHGRCRVAKLGPVLVGSAELAVGPGLADGTTVVQWHEDVTVPRLPRMLSPLVGWISARTFAAALRRMAKRA